VKLDFLGSLAPPFGISVFLFGFLFVNIIYALFCNSSSSSLFFNSLLEVPLKLFYPYIVFDLGNYGLGDLASVALTLFFLFLDSDFYFEGIICCCDLRLLIKESDSSLD
jgi:hypothetical protein